MEVYKIPPELAAKYIPPNRLGQGCGPWVPPRFLLASAFLYHINCHLTTTGVHMWSQSCSIHWALAWGKSLGAVWHQGGRWTPVAGAEVAKPTETKVLVRPHPTWPRIPPLAL